MITSDNVNIHTKEILSSFLIDFKIMYQTTDYIFEMKAEWELIFIGIIF